MRAGKRKEIEDLYLQMYDMLFAYAQSCLGNNALAEEAVQDTFVIACQKAEALLESPNPQGWLVKALKFVISNTVHRQNNTKRLLTEYLTLHSQDLTTSVDRPKLELLYGKLSQKEEFQLLQELAVEGRSYTEMAQDRGITVENCRKRVQRAKKYLQKKLKI